MMAANEDTAKDDADSDGKSPHLHSSSFVCPACGVLTHHIWDRLTASSDSVKLKGQPSWWVSMCLHCKGNTIFNGYQRVYPVGLGGPLPASDMSAPVRAIYEEARAVASASPRAAAALLRVAVEMLVDHLEPGKAKLNSKIGKLVERGLDPQIQQMLDTVRVFGNEGGAHSGKINMNEQPEVLGMLMFCVNTIVEGMITYPKRIAEVYSTLPVEQRKGIEDRDRASHTPNDAGSEQVSQ